MKHKNVISYNADFESRQGMYQTVLTEEVLFSAMYSKSKYFL